jgi:hypothetical protein
MGLAMETALLYNAQILVDLFACVAAWRYLDWIPLPGWLALLAWFPPIGTAVLFHVSSNRFEHRYGTVRHMPLSLFSLVILALCADAVLLMVCWLLKRFVQGRQYRAVDTQRATRWFSKMMTRVVLCGFLLLLLAGIVTRRDSNVRLWLRPQAALTVGSWISILLTGYALVAQLPPNPQSEHPRHGWNRRQVMFVAWVWILAPFLAIGDVVVIPECLTTWTVPIVFVPVALRLYLSTRALPLCQHGTFSTAHKMVTRALWACQVGAVGWTFVATAGHESTMVIIDRFCHPLSKLLLLVSACDVLEMALWSCSAGAGKKNRDC